MHAYEFFRTASSKRKHYGYLTQLMHKACAKMDAASKRPHQKAENGLAENTEFQEAVREGRRIEEKRVEALGYRDAAEAILDRLPSVEQAQLLRLRYLGGATMKEAASQTGYTPRWAYYAQRNAFAWLDEHGVVDEVLSELEASRE